MSKVQNTQQKRKDPLFIISPILSWKGKPINEVRMVSWTPWVLNLNALNQLSPSWLKLDVYEMDSKGHSELRLGYEKLAQQWLSYQLKNTKVKRLDVNGEVVRLTLNMGSLKEGLGIAILQIDAEKLELSKNEVQQCEDGILKSWEARMSLFGRKNPEVLQEWSSLEEVEGVSYEAEVYQKLGYIPQDEESQMAWRVRYGVLQEKRELEKVIQPILIASKGAPRL